MEQAHIAIDEARCEGYGFCADAAPALLELDGAGMLHALRAPEGAAELERAESAARACPVAALRLVRAVTT